MVATQCSETPECSLGSKIIAGYLTKAWPEGNGCFAKLDDRTGYVRYPEPPCPRQQKSGDSSFGCFFWSSSPSATFTEKKPYLTYRMRTSWAKGRSMANWTAQCARWILWPRLRRAWCDWRGASNGSRNEFRRAECASVGSNSKSPQR
jgi:hypothetical protein